MRNNTIKLDIRWIQIILLCVYKITLSIAYVRGVVPTYGYFGFVAESSITRSIISWFLFIILSARLITIGKKEYFTFSKAAVYTLFLLIYVPFSVAISYGMYDTSFFVSNNIYWFILIFFLAYRSTKQLKPLPRISFGDIKIGEKFVNVFGFASLLLILFISWRYTGFRLNFNILNVYDLRSEARSYNFPVLIRYAFGWTRIINSICLCISLIRRKKLMSIIFFFNQVLSFGIDGMKSSMFIMIFEIIIYIMYRYKLYRNEFNLLSLGFNVFSIGSLIEIVIIKTKWIVYLILYRMEFLPVNISSYFYDYFTNNEPDYFRSSFLRLFGFKSPYESIDNMISGIYAGDYSSQANNGLLSDAITNMGYIGIVIMPIILVLFFRFFDRCSQGINRYLVLTLSVYCAMTFSNMFFLPNLLTGGWLIALLITSIIDRDQTFWTSENEV